VPLIAHCDANNFFASVVEAGDLQLKGKAIIVLGSEDKIVISRSKAAKEMGIKMGAPYFEIKDDFFKKGGIAVSANFAQFADVSSRIFSILSQYCISKDLEPYSIDEVFMSLEGYSREKIFSICSYMRMHVLQATGITLSIGIDDTKSRAKVATDYAKKDPLGVFFIDNDEKRNHIYKEYACEDIWGIGKASALKLRILGIKNTYQFISADDHLIRKTLNILRLQTKHELQGIACIDILDQRADRKSILVSRSFNRKVYDKKDVEEALSDHAFRATEKLRDENLVCYLISIFYINDAGYRHHKMILQQGECSHNIIVDKSLELLKEIFQYGHGYKKCGITLDDLRPNNERQLSLIENNYEENEKISSLIDNINQKFHGKLKVMSCSPTRKQDFSIRKTKNYTTSFRELIPVKF
jgi:DNA polymerase V